MAGIASVAMLSMKHAASRPRPPLPSAASGSHLRSSERPTPRSPSAASNTGSSPILFKASVNRRPIRNFQAEVIDPLAAGIVALLFGGEPAMHDAIAQRQRRRLVPVVPGRHAGVLADRQPQLGENGALDLGQGEFVHGLAKRRIIRWERLVLQSLILPLSLGLHGMIRALCRDRNPPRAPFVQCMHGYYARTGPICDILAASIW